MTLQKSIYAQITAIGGYLPEQKRTNEDLEKISDTSDEWIVKRTGIKERRILQDDLATSDMAVNALLELQKSYNKDLQQIDALIVATSTPDMPMPSTANIICDKLNLAHIWAFDINAACSGFLYALEMGANLIETGKYKNVVVVGADKISTYVDIHDRSTNILFGDGAGVVWLEPHASLGVIDAHLLSDGKGREHLTIEAGGTLHPIDNEDQTQQMKYIRQDGKIVFKNAVTAMAKACEDILERNQLTTSDVTYLIPHQANQRIIDAVGHHLNIAPEKALSNIEFLGNTIAATIPLCMWQNKDKFKKGDLLLLTAFGAGFSWGASLLKWSL